MKSRIIIISIAAVLSGCTTTQGAPSVGGPAISQTAALAKAKAAIAYQLKDPESVRWRQAKVAPNGNVCIEVNAKNSYGGYAGFEPYFYNYRTGDLFRQFRLAGRHVVPASRDDAKRNGRSERGAAMKDFSPIVAYRVGPYFRSWCIKEYRANGKWQTVRCRT